MNSATRPGIVEREEPWDVVVIGAGPAGAVSAHLLARQGLSTLLVDRKQFPRAKVCGGCLNARAVGVLREIGLEHAIRSANSAAVTCIRFCQGSRRVLAPLTGGYAIERSLLDYTPVESACRSGAIFLPETAAFVAPRADAESRLVKLQPQHRRPAQIRARVVLACDGLGSSSVARLPAVAQITWRRSRIGIGAIVATGHDHVPHGEVQMVIGREGYVGRVRLGDGRVSLAAAIDAAAVRLVVHHQAHLFKCPCTFSLPCH